MLARDMLSGNGSTTRCKFGSRLVIGGQRRRDELTHDSAYEVLLGIVIGALLGYSARKVMKFAERKRLIDRQSYVAQYVSLAILSIGESRRLPLYGKHGPGAHESRYLDAAGQ